MQQMYFFFWNGIELYKLAEVISSTVAASFLIALSRGYPYFLDAFVTNILAKQTIFLTSGHVFLM